MNESTLRDYDATRDFSDKAFKSVCYAPFISLYFDTLGDVRVCCQNTMHTVGNVGRQSLDEIWRGERIEALRAALNDYQFHLGCRFCEWQLGDGDYLTSFMRTFDEFPVESERPEWPVRMEFSVSNTCNLECIMCNGEWSSSIRSRREKLPPLPKPYGEPFFEDLKRYLPHLKTAKFLGGEPFLAQESLRIWNMMVDMGLSIPCHVTTNGTQYNDRVERILNALPVSFSISMDGITKETVESIRVNAHHETLLENFRRFHAYARGRGTYIGLTFCLMQKNWREFGDYLLFADEWDVEVVINTVIQPISLSLHVLPPEELRAVVETMERQEQRLLPRLGRNRQVWIDQLERLRQRLDANPSESMYFVPLRLTEPLAATESPGGSRSPSPVALADSMTVAQARRRLNRWARGAAVDGWITGADGRVKRLLSDADHLFEVPRSMVLGKPVERINIELHKRHGDNVDVIAQDDRPGFKDKTIRLYRPGTAGVTIRTLNFPWIEAGAAPHDVITLAALTTTPPTHDVRLVDLFLDDPEAAKGSTEAELRQARRRLRRWARTEQVDVLWCDAFDVATAVEGEQFLSLPRSSCLEKKVGEVIQAIASPLGAKIELIAERSTPSSLDRSMRIGDEKRTTYLRSITLPQRSAEGEVTGTVTLAVMSLAAPTDESRTGDLFPPLEWQSDETPGSRAREIAERNAQLEREARDRLHGWCWFEPIDALYCDGDDRVTEAVSERGGFLGLPVAEVVGKRLDQVLEPLGKRWGRSVSVLHEESDSTRMSRLVKFDDGNRSTLVRSETIPTYAADGDVVGVVTLALARPAREASFLHGVQVEPIDREAGLQIGRGLKAWSKRASVGKVRLDSEGVVRSALTPRFLGVEAGGFVGRPVEVLLGRARETAGQPFVLLDESAEPQWLTRIYRSGDSEPTWWKLVLSRGEGDRWDLGEWTLQAASTRWPVERTALTAPFDDRADLRVRDRHRGWTETKATRSLRRLSASPCEGFETDLDDRIIRLEHGASTLLGIPADQLVGNDTDALFAMLREHHGELVHLVREELTPMGAVREVEFVDEGGRRSVIVAYALPRYDEEGRVIGARSIATLTVMAPASVKT